jgi:hypothetical protein
LKFCHETWRHKSSFVCEDLLRFRASNSIHLVWLFDSKNLVLEFDYKNLVIALDYET